MELFLHLPPQGSPPDTALQLDVTTDDGALYAFVTTLALWSRLLAGDGPIEAWIGEPEEK